MKKLLRYMAIVVVLAILGGCVYLNTLLPIITGYAAKNLASAVFISGREAKDVEAIDLNFSLIRYTSNTVDYENKTVTSRFLWGKSTAVYREGCGVTLLCGTSAEELRGQHFPMGHGFFFFGDVGYFLSQIFLAFLFRNCFLFFHHLRDFHYYLY